jgi:hypothetical protein
MDNLVNLWAIRDLVTSRYWLVTLGAGGAAKHGDHRMLACVEAGGCGTGGTLAGPVASGQ